MNVDRNKAIAEPTREFFIDMLVRDIPLQRAIIDVIDNSIDAALRNAPNKDDLSAFKVELIIKDDKFIIKDNCRGMSREIANKYGFSFGRSKDRPIEDKTTIGNFGVGMKRTIFKLGRYFKFISSYNGDTFYIEQDIDEWVQARGEWSFDIKDGTPKDFNYPEFDNSWKGVVIEVTKLTDTVKGDFTSPYYEEKLINEIQMFLSYYINRGIKIKINGTELKTTELSLFNDEIFKAFKFCYTLPENPLPDKSFVKITIIIGLSSREKEEGGWYIFCNNRMILEADQTPYTGWGGDQPLGKKYHATYAYFRGIVYFESSNGDLLPWTTTKTGINIDNDIYKNALNKMTELAIPVMDFLDDVAAQKSKFKSIKEHPDYQGELDGSMSYGEKMDFIADHHKECLAKLDINNYSTVIELPNLTVPIEYSDPNVRIQYSVKRDLATSVKRKLQAPSYGKAGLMTFLKYASAQNLYVSTDDE